MKCFRLMAITYVSCLLLIGLSLAQAQEFASDITSEEIFKIANEGKDTFIGAIGLEYFRQFGKTEAPKIPTTNLEDALNPNSDFNKGQNKNHSIVLGDPFQIFTIETQNILNYDPNIDLASIIVPTTTWLVPVMIHNQPRAILTVNYQDGAWKVVSIGMGDISEKSDKNGKMNTGGKDKTNKFIRIYPAKSDFIVTDKNGNKMIIPFSYTKDNLNLDSKQEDSEGYYESSYFMSKLNARVKSEISQ